VTKQGYVCEACLYDSTILSISVKLLTLLCAFDHCIQLFNAVHCLSSLGLKAWTPDINKQFISDKLLIRVLHLKLFV